MKNNFTDEKTISMAIKKLNMETPKFWLEKKFVSAGNKTKKNFRKHKMKPLIMDNFVIWGMQDFGQYIIVNPININIGRSDHFRRFFKKYSTKTFIYRFCLMSITIWPNININKEILVICTGLNDCKHSDMNWYEDKVLTIIHLENSNWEQLVKTSNWVNIDLVDSQDAKEARSITFGFFTGLALDISKSEVQLRNNNRELLMFGSEENKVPQINFCHRYCYFLNHVYSERKH